MRLPDPHRSSAVLLGTADYVHSADLPSIPGVHNNLLQLAAVLTDPHGGGFTGPRCLPVLNPPNSRVAYEILRNASADATDTLLIYYAGHGLLDADGKLHLAMADTDPTHPETSVSALPITWVKKVLAESMAADRILILDCCFSGRAADAFMGPATDVALQQTRLDGVVFIASAPPNSAALAPIGAPFTAFTGAMIGLLRASAADPERPLTVTAMYQELVRITQARGLPRPRWLSNLHELDLCLTGAAPDLAARRPPVRRAEGPASRHVFPSAAPLGPSAEVDGTRAAPDVRGSAGFEASPRPVIAAGHPSASFAAVAGLAVFGVTTFMDDLLLYSSGATGHQGFTFGLLAGLVNGGGISLALSLPLLFGNGTVRAARVVAADLVVIVALILSVAAGGAVRLGFFGVLSGLAAIAGAALIVVSYVRANRTTAVGSAASAAFSSARADYHGGRPRPRTGNAPDRGANSAASKAALEASRSARAEFAAKDKALRDRITATASAAVSGSVTVLGGGAIGALLGECIGVASSIGSGIGVAALGVSLGALVSLGAWISAVAIGSRPPPR